MPTSTPAPARAFVALAAVGVLASASCAARRSTTTSDHPAGAAATRPALAIPWVSPLHRDHPLVGRIWDARAGRFASEGELRAAVASARFVLLGETHDNPDHHAIQARLLAAVLDAGRRPVLAFEMLDPEQQPAVDEVLAAPAPSTAALRAAVGWDRSGWPAFDMYAPIFQLGLDAKLPIVAANLSRPVARDVVHRGTAGLPEAVRALLDRAGPLPPDEATARREEMKASHCGQLPEAFLDPMVLSQRARDAQLAQATVDGATADGGVLVTGAEHAREDRGAGMFLRLAGAEPAQVVSVGIREVDPDRDPLGLRPSTPAPLRGAYAQGERRRWFGKLPWDIVVFTPGVDRGDPCAELMPPAG